MKASQKVAAKMVAAIKLPVLVEEARNEEEREQRFLSSLRRQSRPITPVVRRVA